MKPLLACEIKSFYYLSYTKLNPIKLMKEIRRIDIMSYAKVYAVIFAIIGFLAGLFVGALGGLISEMSGSSGLGGGFGFLSIIIFPILYGGLGFVFGIIGAAIYNLIAGWVGGIKIELKDTAE
jgi:hypothetical protein